jgi:hypothetical protein
MMGLLENRSLLFQFSFSQCAATYGITSMRSQRRIGKKGHQCSPKLRHLPFGLAPDSACIWIKQCAQPAVLGYELINFVHQGRHSILGNPEPGLSVVTLLLPDLCSIPPEAGSNRFVLITHGMLLIDWIYEA